MGYHTQDGTTDGLGIEPGFEALQSSPKLRGPDEIDGREPCNHLALLYESQAEQFATTIPFIANGLERGDQCLYITDRTDRGDVLGALEDAGVDTAAALDSGKLVIDTVAESYLRNGGFDPDEMIDRLEETIEEASDEDAGFRLTGEMTWAAGDDPPLEELVEYEGKLNRLLSDADGIALCQYDREAFDATVIRDVIETHPYLIRDRTVCHNFYYRPPSELFGSDRSERTVERMVGTLQDRTEARTELRNHREHLQRQTEITGEPDRPFEEKLQALFELGIERFDLELGAMARIDDDRDRFEVEYVSDDHDHFEPGVEFPLSETYCTAATEIEDAGGVTGRQAEEDGDITVYTEFGVRTYLGTVIEIDGGADRTVFFVSSERQESFSEAERAVLRTMGQWVKYELEHEHRDHHQQRLYEIASDPERSFETKLRALFELGTERLDLEFGGLARIDPTTDAVEVEFTSADDERLAPGETLQLPEPDCEVTDDATSTTAIVDRDDREDTGSDSLEIGTYLGTRIEIEHGPDRTFFFAAEDAHDRDREFSDAERSFHRLMAQWVRYELERRHRTRELETSNRHLEQFAHAASHDLQEPLRMVISYLQLLEKRYEDALDEEGKEFLGFAVDGADRMRQMIDGLLAYSRVERRGDAFEPVDLDSVLEDVRADLRLRIEEADAEITVGSLPRVMGDTSQLRQVFQNLLENAITYSGESPRIHVDSHRRGTEHVITVADDGIGIDSDDQERIFAIFDRLHSRGEYPGSGIGLALCRRIVERHGGEIRVDSEPGEGSTFSVTLPAVSGE